VLDDYFVCPNIRTSVRFFCFVMHYFFKKTEIIYSFFNRIRK